MEAARFRSMLAQAIPLTPAGFALDPALFPLRVLGGGGAGVLLSSAQGLCVNLSDPNANWSIASPGETLLSVAS